MADVFNVTANYDQGSYAAGDTITVTIAGNDVETITSQNQIGPVTIPIVAANGSTSTIVVPAEQATVITTTPQSVTIDGTQPILDTSPTPRVWTLSTNKLSISAVA